MVTSTSRLFCCDRCGLLVAICSACDRGNRYCGPECRRSARVETCRRANERYRRSAKGRRNQRRRQKAYRSRKAMMAAAAVAAALSGNPALEGELAAPLEVETVGMEPAAADATAAADDDELSSPAFGALDPAAVEAGAPDRAESACGAEQASAELLAAVPGEREPRAEDSVSTRPAEPDSVEADSPTVTHHGSPTREPPVSLRADLEGPSGTDRSTVERARDGPAYCTLCGRPVDGPQRFTFLSGEDPG